MSRLIYLKSVVTLKFDSDKCFGCGTCLDVCPHGVFVRENGKILLQDRDACMECGACATNCPAGALAVRTGVGCAAAVINSVLGRKSASACCVIEPNDASLTTPSSRSSCC